MQASKFQHLKERYQQLAPREQKSVLAAAVFVSLFIVYQFIWQPLTDRSEYLRKQIVTQQKNLTWMQAIDKNIAELKANNATGAAAITPIALMGVLQEEVNRDGLASQMTELKQSASESVSLVFKKAVFDDVMKMLLHVMAKHKVSIAQLSVTPVSTTGIVDISLTFKTS